MPVALHKLETTLESVGVDWLTCTTPRGSGYESFRALGGELVESEAREGNDVRRLRSQGYHGWSAGGASYGARGDGVMIQLRSDVARERWRDVARVASNVSRLDLQYTVRLDQPRPSIFIEQFRRAKRAPASRGRARSLTLITSTTEGDSVYLGRRVSDLYGRFYDKGREERQTTAGQLLRFEIEAKREAARRYTSQLLATQSEREQTTAIVSTYFKSREIEPLISSEKYREVLTARRSDASRRLIWLRSGVRPTCQKLVEANRGKEALHAVGLCKVAQVECQLCYDEAREDN